ncbi:phosphoserine phosphatase SerB [Pacificimonas sp. WHA3]|uniref:Phosphoserine phosphatase SerB n=1 Tax=Pacificimonas pallii TaxID=2827236 RepID=A0ABS6SED2_9SPHN|nr:phosphoserine phosphatase SerB [Pacificimonas pallii]MBV7256767.1 phosphoserine phosphatase SerB [Pacificimonas pallii]
MSIVTLVGMTPLSRADIAHASETCAADGRTREGGRALDVHVPKARLPGLRDRLESELPHVDIFVRHSAAMPRLFVADMDSTMITVECIDELADYAGRKAEVAAVTEAAMRGELDFTEALHERVAQLAGLKEGAIEDCLNARVTHTPGARALVGGLKAAGARTVLVSGGFTAFALPVGKALGFDRVVANHLQVEGGRLTGRVEGEMVSAATKEAVLREECARLQIPLDAAAAIGDGANDLLMVAAAGTGIAYHAKAALNRAADIHVRNGTLDAVRIGLNLPDRAADSSGN